MFGMAHTHLSRPSMRRVVSGIVSESVVRTRCGLGATWARASEIRKVHLSIDTFFALLNRICNLPAPPRLKCKFATSLPRHASNANPVKDFERGYTYPCRGLGEAVGSPP